MSKSFFDFFPPPKFLEMPAAGVAISDNTVRSVQYEKKNGSLSLRSWGEYPLPKGTIVGGTIEDQENFLDVLKKLAGEKGIRSARVSLPEEKSFIYTSKIIVPDGGDIRTAVEFTLSDNIPLSPGEAIFDFSILNFDEKNHTATVVVAAFPLDVANIYAANFSRAGIMPVNFETESEALTRALIPVDKLGTNLLMHLHKNRVIIVVAGGRAAQFSSVVEISSSEADSGISAIKDELKKVASYWHTERVVKEGAKNKIQSVIVSGDVDGMPDLLNSISSHLRLPARLANVWQNAFSTNDVVPEITFEESLPFAMASGLALTK